MKITHLKSKDIKEFREKLLEKNGGKCPILGIKITPKEAVLDHIHKRKQTDDISETSGVIRNTIHNGVNAFVGKIENGYQRFIPKDCVDLPTLLRNIADYIESGAYIENDTIFSHPTENAGGDMIKMKRIPLSKNRYEKLKNVCKENKIKCPAYNKFITTKINELLISFNLSGG